jgi:sortase A
MKYCFVIVPIVIIGIFHTLSFTAVPITQQKELGGSLPLRLIIPSIHVNANIESLGITNSGTMDVPKNADDVAWFDQGPYPGNRGSAVIAGHLDWIDGNGAVLENLYKLRKGDLLLIKNKEGKSVSFTVKETQMLDSEANAEEVFTSKDGIHLNLITCAGAWDIVKKSYTQRLVVFTDKM